MLGKLGLIALSKGVESALNAGAVNPDHRYTVPVYDLEDEDKDKEKDEEYLASDTRLKDFTPIVNHEYIYKNPEDGEGLQYGPTAQDIQKAVPTVVKDRGDGMLAVNTGRLALATAGEVGKIERLLDILSKPDAYDFTELSVLAPLDKKAFLRDFGRYIHTNHRPTLLAALSEGEDVSEYITPEEACIERICNIVTNRENLL